MRAPLQVYVCGLALDYCVGATARDSVQDGFTTFVVLDACRGITREGSEGTVRELEGRGVHIVSSPTVPVKPGAALPLPRLA